MSTTRHLRRRACRGAAAALVAAACTVSQHVRPATAAPSASTCGGARTLLVAGTSSALPAASSRGHVASRPAYGWPVKPFDRQHPVRAFLNDPRIGSGGGRAFHFGIDVAAPDGTAVYAVSAGTVYFSSRESIAVKDGPDHTFGYWHVVPSVTSHQHVEKHELLGHIASGWGHVHFAERAGHDYVNPLRPGGLGPYTDPVAPHVAEVSLVQLRGGAVQVLANAYDTTWPSVAGPWANEPVAPALLRWRIARDGRVGAWRTAADFRSRMLDAHLFDTIYAPSTAQNHEGEAGLYCFYLAHSWTPANGTYRIEVEASDTRDNRTVAHLAFSVEGGRIQNGLVRG